jgi:succinate-acetate transporter protein
MTTTDSNVDLSPAASSAPAPAPVGPLAGDPGNLGLPSFVVGSLALGLALIGVVPAAAVGATLPILLAATSIGLFIAAIWSAAIGQNAVAGIFGIFGGFWLSYCVLVLGLVHGWLGITDAAAVKSTQELYLVAWLVIIVVLTLATLHLPMAFTAIFALIDVALLLILIGTAQGSSAILKTAGFVVLAFAAVGLYLFYGTASMATGGKGVPMGRPLARG